LSELPARLLGGIALWENESFAALGEGKCSSTSRGVTFVSGAGPGGLNHQTPWVDTLVGRSIIVPAMNSAKASPCKMFSGCTRRCASGVMKGRM